MFYKLSDQVTSRIQQYGSISDEDREIYRYGIQQGLILLLNVITTLVISIVLKMFLDCLLYMIAFIPLRVYAGGYHARTHIRCSIYSAIQILAVLLTIKMLPYTTAVYSAFAFCGFLSVILFSPVADINKPLDELEILIYRKRSLMILTLLCLSIILCHYYHFVCGIKPLSMAIFSVGVLIVLGKMKNALYFQNN